MRRLLTSLVALLIAASTIACGGYSVRLESTRLYARSGALEDALAEVDTLVARAQEGRSPEVKDLPLLLLERASILQALGDHQGATADLNEADAVLEVLDLSPDRAGNAAEYLFSGDRQLYRPPVYEKLNLNIMALSSWLALGQVRAAMVEARRIGVLLSYFNDQGLGDHPMLGAAAYMAAIAMEEGNDRSAALRFALQAWKLIDAPGLPEMVVRLGTGSPNAPAGELQRARNRLGLAAGALPARAEQELLVIHFAGMAPYRAAEHMPIGLALSYMRMNIAYSLGAQQADLTRLMANGLLTWVNFPNLVVVDNRGSQANISVNGNTLRGTMVANLESFALSQWEQDRPGIAFAAITRMITRVVAREAIQAAGRAGGGGGQVFGFLAGLIVQGAMQAADRPDTRTWSLMPAYVWVSRTPVAPGTHQLQVNSSRGSQHFAVNAEAGRLTTVVTRTF